MVLGFYPCIYSSFRVGVAEIFGWKRAVDLDVNKFVGLSDKQMKRAIMKREATDRKKEDRVQVLHTAKEKKEVEQMAKLAEKEKEKEKEREEKAEAKGKKKADNGGQILTSYVVD